MDDEDRQIIGQGVIRVVIVVVLVLGTAVTAGAAFRLFQIVSGI